jgi:hypothetical protein
MIAQNGIVLPGDATYFSSETERGKVLRVPGKRERAGFQDKDPFASSARAEPEMLRDRGAERAAADDDDEIERPHIVERQAPYFSRTASSR